MYTNDANAEQVIFRAAELSVEQRARFEEWKKTHDRRKELDFWTQLVEIEATERISSLMLHYSFLKGYISPEQELKVTRSIKGDRSKHDRY